MIALVGLLISASTIRSLRRPFSSKATWYSTVLSVFLCLFLLFANGPALNSPPLWKTMAGPLFQQTVIGTLRSYGLPASADSGWDALNICVFISNLMFAVSASFILYAVAGLRRDFQTGVVPTTVTEENLDQCVKASLSFIYRLRTLLIVASGVMASGVVNMVAWRFWPLAYLTLDIHESLSAAYGGLAKGSVIYQGAIFSLILLAIFFRPFSELNNFINSNPKLYDQISKNGVISQLFSGMRDVALHLAPLAAGTAAILIPS
jgi:hypothetical protein